MVRLAVTFIVASLLAATGLVAGAGIPRTEPALEGIPAGSKNGFYVGNLKEDGTTVWEYVGPDVASLIASSNATAPAASSEDSSAAGHALVKRDEVDCNGYGLNADHANVAQGEFADMCGSGYFFNSRSIAKVYDDAVAYGCNYGNGQTCTSNLMWTFYAQINSKCGFTHGAQAGAGWYYSPSLKASYGRASAGTGFC